MIHKITLSAIFLLGVCLQLIAQKKGTWNTNRDGVVLDGYDVVTYFKEDKPQKGNPQIKTEYEGVIFWFSAEKNKSEFEKDPAAFLPQYGGWCAYAVAEYPSKVDVNPYTYTLEDGRLYLFFNDKYRGEIVNTKLFWQDDPQMKSRADANWSTLK